MVITTHRAEHLLYGVLNARDGEEGCEVGSVRGDDDQREHPPEAHHHPGGKCGVRHLSACRGKGYERCEKQDLNRFDP